ncbi:MAG: RdgB/HAM1 family non-canonical purine NTP pyrophosphatase [Gemmataceae bacterium]
MPILVVGTRNPKKRIELLEILGDLPIELRDLTGYPQAPEVEEDGETFEANARKKAGEVAKALGEWTLGEDSGLVVPALKGRPGVYSARYAGKQGDDEANNDKLLAELAPLQESSRAAYYVCTAALADPTGEVKAVVEGRCHGVILRERRGTGGFGYDPLFYIPEYHQTFGQLTARVKHALSHRGKAMAALRPAIRRYLLPE